MKAPLHPPEGRAGFTLTEFLLAFGIAATLATITITLLSQFYGLARKAVCISSLRQLGMATQMYLDDNSQTFFPYVERTDEGTVWYFGLENPGASAEEGQRLLVQEAGPLYPYLQEVGSVEICPGFDYRSKRWKAKFNGASWGYGYNWRLGGGWAGRDLVRFTDLSSPARVIVFGDCAQINTFQAPASPSNPMLEEFYIINERFATVHFRHKGKAAFLFADGHVESLPIHPGTRDERLSGEIIGRITERGSMEFLE